MTQDIIRQYIVCINEGSGVIFQPLDINTTYILTADHVITDRINKGKQTCSIQYFNHDAGTFVVLDDIVIKAGENYFPHPNSDVDIAVVKVARLPNVNNLVLTDDIQNAENYYVVGFPNNRREDELVDAWISVEKVQRFLLSRPDGKREAEFEKPFTYEDVEGLSGSGIFKHVNGYFYILGIQNQIPYEDAAKSSFELTPIKLYNEIVVAHPEKLEIFNPVYLKSFSPLESEIFRIKYGLPQQEGGQTITQILKAKAKEIIDSDITPQSIKNYLQDQLMLIHGQSNDVLNKKKIWSLWLELFTILNVAKNKQHQVTDLPGLFQKIRLFYSDTDDDFWITHLNDLAKADFTDLQENALVVVASNCEAMGNAHVLNLDSIPDNIANMRRQHDIDQLGINIGSSTEFPLDKFKFLNISAFKENTVINNYNEFNFKNIGDCLNHLNKLYGDIIN